MYCISTQGYVTVTVIVNYMLLSVSVSVSSVYFSMNTAARGHRRRLRRTWGVLTPSNLALGSSLSSHEPPVMLLRLIRNCQLHVFFVLECVSLCRKNENPWAAGAWKSLRCSSRPHSQLKKGKSPHQTPYSQRPWLFDQHVFFSAQSGQAPAMFSRSRHQW